MMEYSPAEKSLAEQLRLPPKVRLAYGSLDSLQQAIFAEETAHIAKAVEKRKREFTAGRNAARQALARSGIAPQPILPGEGRNPSWPAGCIGSITHSDTHSLAVAARTEDFISLGVDLEMLGRISPDLWKALFVEEEKQLLASAPPWMQTVIFCAKEAFFKMQFPHTAFWLDFHNLRITPKSEGVVEAVALIDLAAPFGGRIHEINYAILEGQVAAFCHIQ